MPSGITFSEEDAFVVDGKLALPYQYFAGRTGSRFLVALGKENKILGIKCRSKVFVPPRSADEHDIGEKCSEWVELPGTGTVTGFTVVRYEEPYQPLKPPYIIALIRLDGTDNCLTHIVKGISPDEMSVGLRVRPVFAKETTSTIMDIDHFAPDEEPEPKEKSRAGREPEPERKRKPPGETDYRLGYSYDELEVGMSASFT